MAWALKENVAGHVATVSMLGLSRIAGPAASGNFTALLTPNGVQAISRRSSAANTSGHVVNRFVNVPATAPSPPAHADRWASNHLLATRSPIRSSIHSSDSISARQFQLVKRLPIPA